VLGVGIDWSEEFHLVALGTPEQGITEVARVEHSPKRSKRWWPGSRRLSPTRARSESSSRAVTACSSSDWSTRDTSSSR